jgi:hypothetical protein
VLLLGLFGKSPILTRNFADEKPGEKLAYVFETYMEEIYHLPTYSRYIQRFVKVSKPDKYHNMATDEAHQRPT